MTTEPHSQPLSGFYGSVDEGANRIMALAAEVKGIDDEIALLRAALRDIWLNRRDEVDLLFKGTRLLVQAVAARHRMTPKDSEELFDALARAAQGIHDQIFGPPEVEEV